MKASTFSTSSATSQICWTSFQCRRFITDVSMFRSDWKSNGPMVPGIKPMDAYERLRKFESTFANYKRRWDTYAGGEELF
eukprot:SAG22_NODE_11595_length_478_cov_0.635884_2_plen_79_part_01